MTSAPAKPIRMNAFVMNTVGHQSPGLWAHPRDQSSRYNELSYWTDLARLLERGCFDAMFIADVLGVYDVFGGDASAAIADAVQLPINDPFVLVPAMAHVTSHLGFGVTGNISHEPPLSFARRMSTLDHLTGGRVGWNIVTGYLKSAAKGMGRDGLTGHDQRYEIAEEFMSLVYALWEAGWDDDAVRRDRAARVFADPDKVRKIRHDGAFFQLEAIPLAEPSPQRTPVLYQAGASPRGRAFAARHAECVFIAGPSKQVIAPWVADIRRRAAEAGRDPSEVLIFAEITVIPGETEAAARAKHDEYRHYVSREGALAMVGGWTGVDFEPMEWDAPIEYQENDALRSHLQAITTADPEKVWTKRELADFAGIGGIAPVLVGDAGQVCDAMQGWMDDTDIDGFNLAYAVSPESFGDFVDLVAPELQRRGVYRRSYDPGPLRTKLWPGTGARLRPPHPAAAARETARA